MTSAREPIVRVLLGDDHRIVREGLKMVLAEDPRIQVVAEADTGPAVLDAVQNLQGPQGVDVALLDIAMPGMDGLDVLQMLRRDWPALPVLMLSTYPEKQYAVRCIKLGAAGYLNKSTDPDELMAVLHRVVVDEPPRRRSEPAIEVRDQRLDVPVEDDSNQLRLRRKIN